MPRKKSGNKKPKVNELNGADVQNDENTKKNGSVEKVKYVINEDRHDTISIDSKTSRSSAASIKKRFSFGKKKKTIDIAKASEDSNGADHNGDVRRTNSLNYGQESGKSRIPILKYKHQSESKKGKKLSPRLNKPGNYECRSLVLNPGMDSWRMAGLLDTVSNTNFKNSLHASTNDNIFQPPAIALSSGLSKDMLKSLQKVQDPLSTDGEVMATTRNNGVVHSPPIVSKKKENTSESICPMEAVETNHLQQQQQTETVSSVHACCENTSQLPPQHVRNDNPDDVSVPEILELVTSEECSYLESAPCEILEEVSDNTPTNVPVVNDNTPTSILVVNDNTPTNVLVVNEPTTPLALNINEEISEDIFCAGIEPEGASTSSANECNADEAPPTPCNADEATPTPDVNATLEKQETDNGSAEYISEQELYKLDSEHVISIRKLGDLILETQMQMPKEVCCDDWLVVDFSHAVIST